MVLSVANQWFATGSAIFWGFVWCPKLPVLRLISHSIEFYKYNWNNCIYPNFEHLERKILANFTQNFEMPPSSLGSFNLKDNVSCIAEKHKDITRSEMFCLSTLDKE